uniref:hypothetical protein n=1 Tax=Methylocystis sp. TaxID=1911079 RepID=UPI0025FEAEAD
MASTQKNPDAGGVRARELFGCVAALNDSENTHRASPPQEFPPRATLARCWPGLRVNRLTWRWVDVASGRRGDSIETLLAFLGEA